MAGHCSRMKAAACTPLTQNGLVMWIGGGGGEWVHRLAMSIINGNGDRKTPVVLQRMGSIVYLQGHWHMWGSVNRVVSVFNYISLIIKGSKNSFIQIWSLYHVPPHPNQHLTLQYINDRIFLSASTEWGHCPNLGTWNLRAASKKTDLSKIGI